MATDPTSTPQPDPQAAPDGSPIVVHGKAGGVSIEQIGSHPVVYTGEETPGGQAPDSIDAAFARLRQGTPAPSGTGVEDASRQPQPAVLLGLAGTALEGPYAARSDQRETAGLEQQLADLHDQDARQSFAEGALNAAKDFAKDFAKGVVVEGGQAALAGAQHAANNTLDLVEHIADQLPGAALVWGDTDHNPATPNGLRLETGTGTEMKQKTGLARFLPRFTINPKDEPSTNTGKVIEGISQFGTGMLGAGKLLKGWAAVGKVGQIGKAMAQGAISDFSAFDAHQQRLSDLLQHVAPEQAKPIFEYLASNQEDGEIVGRLKNAVEGLGLGAMSESVFHGIRALKAARLAKAHARLQAKTEGLQVDPAAEAEALSVQARATHDGVRSELGDETATGPLVNFNAKVKRNSGAAKPGEVTGATIEPNSFDINFARIQTPDDVKAVISTLLEKHAGDAEAARRGVRSWEETQRAAGKLDWVAAMAQRKTGDAVNAETAFAYRQALNASATRLLELARKVKAEPSVANQYAFRRMMSVHRAIQLEFMGARAEAGRSLNAFKIPAGTPERSLRQIDSLLADAGGANAAQDMAGRLLDAAEKGDSALNTFVQQGAFAHSRAMIKLVYTNSLLTALGSPIRNVLGNASAIMLNMTSRLVSPRMAKALGDQPYTQVGEAAAIAHGYVSAIRDMFQLNPLETWRHISANGGEALRRDGLFRGMAPGLDMAAPDGIRLRSEREEAGAAIGETMQQRPLSAAAFGVDEDTVLGRALDVAQMVVESPSNLNSTADDFFKVIAARGELHAQAFRQAMKELEAGIHDDMQAAKARMQDLVDQPTDAMLRAAEAEMHELTFTRKTPGIAEAFSKLRAAMDSRGPVPVGQIFLPFLRTPANLISMGLRYSPLAPFMRRYAEDLAAGGAKAEVAKAQWAIGSALWSLWVGMAADGKLSGMGPGNPGQKQALMRQDEFGGVRWQPNSMKIGERWVSFQGLDPISTTMGMAASMGEIMANSDWSDERDQNMSEVSAHAIAAIGQAFFDKTMLQSAMEASAAMTSGDPAAAEQMLKQRASGLVPASGFLRTLRRGMDPYLRDTADIVDAIKNTIPGLSETLPAQHDLWGNVRTYQTGLGTVYDAVAPVQTKEAGGAAIDQEILRQGVPVTMPAKTLSVNGESVSIKNRPDIYEDYVQLAGKPAFEQLEAVVTGGHEDSDYYRSLSDGPDGDKSRYIKDVINAFRRDARAQIADKYGADLEAMAADQTRRRAQARAEAQ